MKKFIIGFVALLLLAAGGVFYWYYIQQKNLGYPEAVKLLKIPGVLTVAGDIPYGAMEFVNDQGQPDGFDVEFSREIATRLGVRLNYKDYDWDALFPTLQSGEIDLVISTITITPERAESFLFSSPYFYGGQTVITRADDQEIKSLADVKDKKIGVQAGTTSNEEAKKYTDEKNIIAYPEFLDSDPGSGIIYGLKEGKTDLIITDYVLAVSVVRKNPSLKILGEPFTQEYYGVMVKKGNDNLVAAVNQIIKEMKQDGRLAELEAKWKK